MGKTVIRKRIVVIAKHVTTNSAALCEWFAVFRTSAAPHSGPTPGWPQLRRVRGTAASHDHPTGSLLEKGGKKISTRVLVL